MTRAMCRIQHAAVLFLLCACALVAMAEPHRCIHQELVKSRERGPVSLPAIREDPEVKRDGWLATSVETAEWAPIRIGVFTEDMHDPTRYCTRKDDERSSLTGGIVKCSARDIFTEAKRTTIVNRILPAAIQLHRDRLLVKPVRGIIVLPRLPGNDLCARFSIPKAHFTTGVSGIDMALYAAAAPTGGSTLAWALTCVESGGRPVAGVMNFGPHSVEDTSASIRTAAHEMAHALGFSFEAFMRKGVISDPLPLRGKPSAVLMTSKKTAEKAREHFGCPTAIGMELEDEGGLGTALSHWERRNAKDELMAGISGLGVYSALTMAAFEDLGVYRANWGMEEPLLWGRNKGCDLLEKPCVSNGVTNFPDMFCTSKEETMSCTSDRRGLGRCSIVRFTQSLPSQFRYFQNPTVGGAEESDLTDFCPYVFGYSDTSCATGFLGVMPGSTIGPNARCLKGENLVVDQAFVGDICADVMCDKDRTVRVRYYGDSQWYTCADGEAIVPKTTFSSGRIMCPHYDEVCVA